MKREGFPDHVVRGDAAKIAGLAIMMGDDEDMKIFPRSVLIPAWGRRFIIDKDNGDILKVQVLMKDPSQAKGRRFKTVGEAV